MENKSVPDVANEYDKDLLKNRLTPLQFRVTQEKITERPWSGKYVKLSETDWYSCVVCDEELFSSDSKFDSGCGWPTFFDVTQSSKVKLSADYSLVGSNLLLLALKSDMVRTEVSCAKCGAHLGHLFNDGPKPSGKRYCINSASLQFFSTKNDDTTDGNNELTKEKESNKVETSKREEASAIKQKLDNTSTNAYIKPLTIGVGGLCNAAEDCRLIAKSTMNGSNFEMRKPLMETHL